jgi:hypothetical protein
MDKKTITLFENSNLKISWKNGKISIIDSQIMDLMHTKNISYIQDLFLINEDFRENENICAKSL